MKNLPPLATAMRVPEVIAYAMPWSASPCADSEHRGAGDVDVHRRRRTRGSRAAAASWPGSTRQGRGSWRRVSNPVFLTRPTSVLLQVNSIERNPATRKVRRFIPLDGVLTTVPSDAPHTPSVNRLRSGACGPNRPVRLA